MLRVVSVATAAGILLAAPVSAAVMQVVLTGFETSRYVHDERIRLDDSDNDFANFGHTQDYAGTAVTWTLRYDTDLGTVRQDEYPGTAYTTIQRTFTHAITHSTLAHGGDTFTYNPDQQTNTGSSILTYRNVDTDPNDGYDNSGEFHQLEFSTSTDKGPNIQDGYTISWNAGKAAHFTPWDLSTPFDILLSSNDFTQNGGSFDWSYNENFYNTDGSYNGIDYHRIMVSFDVTSLSVTQWDDGSVVNPPVSPVPLPATAPLLLAALGGAFALRLRKRA